MKTIFTLIALTISITANAQLNKNSEALQKLEPTVYSGVRCKAVKQWGNDNKMVVYTINQQADAYVTMQDLREKVSEGFINTVFTGLYDPECGTIDFSLLVYKMKAQIKNSNY